MLALRGQRQAGRSRRARRWGVAIVATALSALSLSACGVKGTAAAGDTLTVALPGWTPQSFDLPTNCSSPLFELAYEPLIRLTSTGQHEPGLAESWQYSQNNTVFTMKIRSGAKFADGTDVTAKSVVDTLNYYKSVPGLNDGFIKPLTIKADGSDSVRISYQHPYRGMETLLSSDGVCNNGMIISAAGLKDPAKLKTQMFGAGPYEYVASDSEPGDHYTFVPNPNYYDKSRQHWKKVVLRIIADPNTAFNALATGQVQVDMTGGQTLFDQATAKGMDATRGVTWGSSIMVWDRSGQVSKPLADVRVRRAMALALDRDNIAKVAGPGAQAIDQFAMPGLTGSDPNLASKYTYDVEEAKRLMAAAGYADGFSVTMLTDSDDLEGKNVLSAAVDQLGKIGVHVTIKSSPETTFFGDIASKKYALGGVSWGLSGDVSYDADRLYQLPFSAVLNPFASVDPELTKAYDALATADDSTVADASKSFNEVMTAKAWYIPITAASLDVYSKGIDVGVAGPLGEFDVASWKPKS